MPSAPLCAFAPLNTDDVPADFSTLSSGTPLRLRKEWLHLPKHFPFLSWTVQAAGASRTHYVEVPSHQFEAVLMSIVEFSEAAANLMPYVTALRPAAILAILKYLKGIKLEQRA